MQSSSPSMSTIGSSVAVLLQATVDGQDGGAADELARHDTAANGRFLQGARTQVLRRVQRAGHLGAQGRRFILECVVRLGRIARLRLCHHRLDGRGRKGRWWCSAPRLEDSFWLCVRRSPRRLSACRVSAGYELQRVGSLMFPYVH